MEIFDVLKELNLPYKKYVIVGGGVMEALGIKLTEDIDIVVTEEIFEKYIKSGNWIVSNTPKGSKKLKKYIDHPRLKKIEIYLDVNSEDFTPTIEELIKRSITVKGFSFISLSDLINFKKAYRRPKDRIDLDLINLKLA